MHVRARGPKRCRRPRPASSLFLVGAPAPVDQPHPTAGQPLRCAPQAALPPGAQAKQHLSALFCLPAVANSPGGHIINFAPTPQYGNTRNHFGMCSLADLYRLPPPPRTVRRRTVRRYIAPPKPWRRTSNPMAGQPGIAILWGNAYCFPLAFSVLFRCYNSF